MVDGPIARAHVEITPEMDASKFEEEINKAINSAVSGVRAKIDAAFNFDKAESSAAKAGAKIKALGVEGAQAGARIKAGASEATSGLSKVEAKAEGVRGAINKLNAAGRGSESVFRRVGTRIATAFSIYAVARFAKESVDVALAYDRMNRIVEQAFKTTGHVAGVTLGQFDALSASMARTTGLAETGIRGANEQLIAFTNIRNVAGQGNDIFTRTAKAVEDVSVRTGLGAIQIARSLGKAIEEPARASMVLRRASIILTEQQKKQIVTFEKSNNTLAAQKVVLDAIEQKYRGSATAAADPLKQLAVATNQIERSLGGALLPTINRLAEVIITHTPQIQRFVAALGVDLQKAIVFVTPFVAAAVKVIKEIVSTFEHSKGIQTFTKYLLASVIAFKAFREIASVVGVALKVVNSAMKLFDSEAAVGEALIAPELLIGAAIVAIGAAAVYAYKHIKPFHDAVDKFVNMIKDAVLPVLKEMWAFFEKNILPTLKEIGRIILEVLIAHFKILVAYIKDLIIPAIKFLWSILSIALIPILKVLGTVAVTVFKAIPDVIRHFVIPAIQFLANAVLLFFTTLVHGAAGAFGWVPKIGPKLKAAARRFDQFRDDVNASLNGIIADKTISIHIKPALSQNATIAEHLQLDKAAKAKGEPAPAPSGADPYALPPDGQGGLAGSKSKSAKQGKGPANLAELIRSVSDALNAGLTKGSEAASKTVSSLEAKIKSTLSGTLQAGLASGAIAFIEKQRNALSGLAGAYFKVSKETDVLKKKVDILTKAAQTFKDSVLSALEQTSNLSAFLSQSGSGASGGNIDKGPLAQASFNGIAVGAGTGGGGQAQSLVNFLMDQAKQLTAFKHNLNTLISRVGDSTFVQELASKGLASADLVKSLAGAPMSTLKHINALQSQILTLQHNVANAAGKKLQDAADKANVLLKQSVSTQDKILVELKAMSYNIVNGLARLLGTKVPRFAEGGIHNSPTLGWVGEAGREVTIPLQRPSRAMSLMDQTGLLDMARGGSGGARSATTHYNSFNLVPQGDPAIHAVQIATRLEAMVTR